MRPKVQFSENEIQKSSFLHFQSRSLENYPEFWFGKKWNSMAMRRDCFLALFLCHAVVSEVTNASLWDSRKLLEPASNNNSTRTSQVILYFLEERKRMNERMLSFCLIYELFVFAFLGFPSHQSDFFCEHLGFCTRYRKEEAS